MKNIIWTMIFLLSGTFSAAAQRTDAGLTTPEQLGISAGIAMACKIDADTLKNYELIASRLLANPTETISEEKAVFKAYAEAKLDAYKSQKKNPQMSCPDVLKRFEKQPLFQSVVYRDGTVKLPDGKVVKPARPLKTTAVKK